LDELRAVADSPTPEAVDGTGRQNVGLAVAKHTNRLVGVRSAFAA
jgi:hypothetical protein